MVEALVLVFVIFFTAAGHCIDNSWMLPYERTSINDCEVRFVRNVTSTRFLHAGYNAAGTVLGEFAHIAAIGWTQQDGTVEWLCGGSLIADSFILTAAHCAADWKLTAPDVARMGDINIYSDQDDEYAQQLTIVQVIRHPKHRFGVRYYDIALMKLETNVWRTSYVAPICLWLQDEIPSTRLLAAGWGQTDTYGETSQNLLQVELSLVNNSECAKHHPAGGIALRSGIEDHQICAVDPVMDLCPGDSGGPLLVKLNSFFGVYAPFLVGVTSFGKACGLAIPGVFVKVSKFRKWIFQQLELNGERISPQLSDPVVCASHYAERSGKKSYGNTQPLFIISVEFNDAYTVSLEWSGTAAPIRCSGTLIEPNVVLTLAQCTSHQGAQPSRVVFADSTAMKIRDVIVHPNFTEHAPYHNNIAVLRLESYASAVPACGWYEDSFPVNNIKIQGYNYNSQSILVSSTITPQTDCNAVRKYSSPFPQGIQDEHICFKNPHFLIPHVCDLKLGASIQPKPTSNFVWGLNMLGRDCGYGVPAVGVRLSAHKAWLESVLLPRSSPRNEGLVYIDSDLDVQDECKYADGTKGTCTPQQNCPAIHARLQSKEQLLFCGNTAVVCCPERATNLETKVIEDEFNECEARYRHLRTERQTNTSHMAEIGWQEAESVTYDCYGYLISTRGIVSSASCLLGKAKLPNIVRLGGLGTRGSSEIFRVEEFIFHPKYNRTTQQHNIAIVKLESAVEPSEHVFPGCLWQNVTHSPVLQQVYDYDSNQYYSIHPMYQSDCESVTGDLNLQEPEATCMNPGWIKYYHNSILDMGYSLKKDGSDDMKSVCFQSGNPIIWRNFTQSEAYTEYLVHTYNYGECNETSVRIVERVAMYIDWFKQALL